MPTKQPDGTPKESFEEHYNYHHCNVVMIRKESSVYYFEVKPEETAGLMIPTLYENTDMRETDIDDPDEWWCLECDVQVEQPATWQWSIVNESNRSRGESTS